MIFPIGFFITFFFFFPYTLPSVHCSAVFFLHLLRPSALRFFHAAMYIRTETGVRKPRFFNDDDGDDNDDDDNNNMVLRWTRCYRTLRWYTAQTSGFFSYFPPPPRHRLNRLIGVRIFTVARQRSCELSSSRPPGFSDLLGRPVPRSVSAFVSSDSVIDSIIRLTAICNGVVMNIKFTWIITERLLYIYIYTRGCEG